MKMEKTVVHNLNIFSTKQILRFFWIKFDVQKIKIKKSQISHILPTICHNGKKPTSYLLPLLKPLVYLLPLQIYTLHTQKQNLLL